MQGDPVTDFDDPSLRQIVIHGVSMNYDEAVKVRVGPIVGKVTHTTAIVLLEVDCSCRVTCNVFAKGSLRKQFSQDMPANKPRAFNIVQLEPQTSYQVIFSGVNKTDMKSRICKFNTLAVFPARLRVAAVSCDKPEALQEGEHNMWEKLALSVSKGEIDMVIHVGNQVYATEHFEDAWALLRRFEEVWTNGQDKTTVEEAVKDRIRDAYRFTWNLPYVRQVMAYTSHLMIWGDNDVCKDFTLNLKRRQRIEPRILQLAQAVYREYQRQLWDPLYMTEDSNTEYHSHIWGQIGMCFLDLRSNFIAEDGTLMFDRQLISNNQWTWLSECLTAEGLKTLVICCEYPFLNETLSDTVTRQEANESFRSQWSYHSTELVRLLDMLFMWKKAKRGREVQFVCGGARVGMQTTVSDSATLLSIEQIVCSPITDTVAQQQHSTTLYGKISDRFSFRHRPMQSQRNFGVVTLFASWEEGGRVESTLVGSYDTKVNATLGPVIGKVTARSAVILLEVYTQASITCVVTDATSGRRHTSVQVMPSGRPRAFCFDTLDPGHKYNVQFIGINNPEDRRGSFSTPKLTPTSFQALFVSDDRPDMLLTGDVNVWKEVEDMIEQESVDCVVHLGGQVFAEKAFEDGWTLLRRHNLNALNDEERENLFEEVRAILRSPYRFSWNLPHTKGVLASTSNIMIWSYKDIHTHFASSFLRGAPVSPTMIKLAVQVYREYQRALWDTHAGYELQSTDEFSFHTWGAFGTLMLDVRGNKITPKGEAMPENPFVSGAQWAFIEKALRSPGLKVLVVCCEYPFVADAREDVLLKDAQDSAQHTNTSDYNFWPRHSDDLCKLLTLLFEWMGASFRDRRAVLIGGGMRVGCDSVIMDSKTNLEIQHVATGPVTDTPTSFPCQLEGTISARFSFVHRPHEYQRNFCAASFTLDSRIPTTRVRVITDRDAVVSERAPDRTDDSLKEKAIPEGPRPFRLTGSFVSAMRGETLDSPLRSTLTSMPDKSAYTPMGPAKVGRPYSATGPKNTTPKLDASLFCSMSVNGKHKYKNGICKLCGVAEAKGDEQRGGRPSSAPPHSSVKEHGKRVVADLDDFEVTFDRIRMKNEYLTLLQQLENKDRELAVKHMEFVQEFKDKEQALLHDIKERDEQITYLQERIDYKTTTIKLLQETDHNVSAIADRLDEPRTRNRRKSSVMPSMFPVQSPVISELSVIEDKFSTPPRGADGKGRATIILPQERNSLSGDASRAARHRLAISASKCDLPASIIADISGAAVSEEKIKAAFDAIDVDSNGYITVEEFEKFYAQIDPFGLSEPSYHSEIKPLIKKFNTLDGERIVYDEFVIVMLKIASR